MKATMEIYTPKCEEAGCGSRVTRRITEEDGTQHEVCAKHAGPLLIALSKQETKIRNAG